MFSFGKKHKLCSRTTINEVFDSGEQLKFFPYVVRYKEASLSDNMPFQVVFSAPKRIFRKAHERNRVKRICREAFRLNKHELQEYLEDNNKQLALFVVYTSKKELEHNDLQKRTTKLFQQLIKQLEHDQS